MTAEDHLRGGDLASARAELIAAVKRAPADQGARMYLFQLLCVCGEWDKAVTHLRALAQLSPEAQMLATVYGQAIDAERARAAAFAGRGAFPFVMSSGLAWTEDLSAALQASATGRDDEAAERREAAFDAAADTPGTVDGEAFAWVADADARFGPVLEIVLNGKWGLLPFEVIERIQPEPVRDLRDLVWLPVQIRLRSGLSSAALVPARYPGSEAGDAQVQLARTTLWQAAAGGERGSGQRLLAFDARDDIGLLSLSTVEFDAVHG